MSRQPEHQPPAPSPTAESPVPPRVLTPEARRALEEAAARRAAYDAKAAELAAAKEKGGPAGPDPVRYGDWENKGIASDF